MYSRNWHAGNPLYTREKLIQGWKTTDTRLELERGRDWERESQRLWFMLGDCYKLEGEDSRWFLVTVSEPAKKKPPLVSLTLPLLLEKMPSKATLLDLFFNSYDESTSFLPLWWINSWGFESLRAWRRRCTRGHAIDPATPVLAPPPSQACQPGNMSSPPAKWRIFDQAPEVFRYSFCSV